MSWAQRTTFSMLTFKGTLIIPRITNDTILQHSSRIWKIEWRANRWETPLKLQIPQNKLPKYHLILSGVSFFHTSWKLLFIANITWCQELLWAGIHATMLPWACRELTKKLPYVGCTMAWNRFPSWKVNVKVLLGMLEHKAMKFHRHFLVQRFAVHALLLRRKNLQCRESCFRHW